MFKCSFHIIDSKDICCTMKRGSIILYNACVSKGGFQVYKKITIWSVIYILITVQWLERRLFITRVTRRVPFVGKELIILPKHLSLPLVFSGVHLTQS
jgi:hypothetical protein